MRDLQLQPLVPFRKTAFPLAALGSSLSTVQATPVQGAPREMFCVCLLHSFSRRNIFADVAAFSFPMLFASKLAGGFCEEDVRRGKTGEPLRKQVCPQRRSFWIQILETILTMPWRLGCC